jgi:hypothetical protein
MNDAEDGQVSTTTVRFVKHSELVKVKFTVEFPAGDDAGEAIKKKTQLFVEGLNLPSKPVDPNQQNLPLDGEDA